MEGKEFERKKKEDKPVLAICYDFDKTLSPDDMQAQGYIQAVGYNTKEFWTESNSLAENNDMDQNLAYMYKMVEEAEGNFVFTREKLAEYGAEVGLFPGVEEWFERIRKYGDEKGVIIEHYIISSGLKEMIEGTKIARNGVFKKIYASSFYFNKRGVAKWPAQVVNYTNKTQFLFRIEKGTLDVNDPGVNEYFQPDEIRVPFRNMVYIGDSDTDIPCMKLVNTYGGHSIGVYNSETNDKRKVYKMINDNRIKYFAPADYNENSELDILIKSIIDRTVANELLETIHYKHKDETLLIDKRTDEVKQRIDNLIAALQNSRSFVNTHTVVSELKAYNDLEKEQKDVLYKAALDNQQVFWILKDSDVSNFYLKLIGENLDGLSDDALKIKKHIEEDSVDQEAP